MKKLGLLMLSMTLILLVGCKKYDEGGASTNAKSKMVGAWTLTEYIENGENKTNSLVGLRMELNEDNTYKRVWLFPFNFESTETGTWKITNFKKSVLLTTSENKLELYHILLLTETDFKVESAGNDPKTFFTFKKE